MLPVGLKMATANSLIRLVQPPGRMNEESGKKSARGRLGRLKGRLKGGPARSDSLKAEERCGSLARNTARARWRQRTLAMLERQSTSWERARAAARQCPHRAGRSDPLGSCSLS